MFIKYYGQLLHIIIFSGSRGYINNINISIKNKGTAI